MPSTSLFCSGVVGGVAASPYSTVNADSTNRQMIGLVIRNISQEERE